MTTTRPPSVDALARTLARDGPGQALPFALLVALTRKAIDAARAAGNGAQAEALARKLVTAAAAGVPQRIVNATGVLLHTNLGRAPLHPDAARRAAEVATGYGNVEFDLASGKRGGRHHYVDQLLQAVTGAEAGIAVNNNAAALLLSLGALAAPNGVLVSRGELIEIGGSFRLPELMAASGAVLIEVGTTNRTRAADYERRVEGAAAVLKVHPSNYRVEGFAEEVGYGELADIAAGAGLPFIADVGSGLLDARTPWLSGPPPSWLASEPGVRQTLEAGADVVLFSGDKLLGGPQAGLAVGKRAVVDRMAEHPTMRALRLDGPQLAALAATLELYADGRGAEIPFWAMAACSDAELRTRLQGLMAAAAVGGEIVAGASLPGAGSVPGEEIPSPVLAVTTAVDARWRRLLDATPAVLTRRQEHVLLIDLRAVDPADDAHIAAALA
ncbi:MAG TPA: L-seryl-tRNA(Sec) selenium transferase [Acidimicrobiia bacterium]|jgi:L-seryl-tRNA(Ser) seleniumtransferase|nr:L-seryl-tRNA(Sec) selenium transferase [Acidimicrobiia bacterium]